MRRTLKLFLLKPGAPLGAPPEPGPELELEARVGDIANARHDRVATGFGVDHHHDDGILDGAVT